MADIPAPPGSAPLDKALILQLEVKIIIISSTSSNNELKTAKNVIASEA
jgi:hypothetical protein